MIKAVIIIYLTCLATGAIASILETNIQAPRRAVKGQKTTIRIRT